MVVLFALKIFIAAWRWALRASRRFSARTLRVLAACNVVVFLLCCWTFYEEGQRDEEAAHELSGYVVVVWHAGSASSYYHPHIFLELNHILPAILAHKLYSPKQQTYDPLDLRKLFRRETANLVQVSAPEREDFQHTILFWLSLIGMVVSPITTMATLLLTWISLHRRRAEALLMRLELEKRRLEIEQLRLELERARKEHEESNAASPKIILLS